MPWSTLTLRSAAHRSWISIFYDRLEIENPGLLPPALTVEDLLRDISKPRNRVIGRGVFHVLGLVEQGEAASSG